MQTYMGDVPASLKNHCVNLMTKKHTKVDQSVVTKIEAAKEHVNNLLGFFTSTYNHFLE